MAPDTSGSPARHPSDELPPGDGDGAEPPSTYNPIARQPTCFLANPWTQVTLMGIICFCCPGVKSYILLSSHSRTIADPDGSRCSTLLAPLGQLERASTSRPSPARQPLRFLAPFQSRHSSSRVLCSPWLAREHAFLWEVGPTPCLPAACSILRV